MERHHRNSEGGAITEAKTQQESPRESGLSWVVRKSVPQVGRDKRGRQVLQAGSGAARLQFQHSGDRGRKIMRWRPAW
jgi:hypothetical protein